MHRNRKPVRKCHGCPLSLGERCAIYDIPHDQWHNKERCPGYMNDVMLAAYMSNEQKLTIDRGRSKRREAMKLLATEQHYQGLRDPVRRACGK